MLVSRGLARLTRQASGLIASEPHATFWTVSGVVVAAFVATYLSTVLDDLSRPHRADAEGALHPGVVEVYVRDAPEDAPRPRTS